MFPRWGTHFTGDMCFPGGGTHITRDMCFPGGEHISLGICVFQVGEHISLGICVSKVGEQMEGPKLMRTIKMSLRAFRLFLVEVQTNAGYIYVTHA